MRKRLIAALAVCAFVATALGTVTPASAHHPSTMWYHGAKYWLSDYYDPDYCFHHHGYNYCKRPSY